MAGKTLRSGLAALLFCLCFLTVPTFAASKPPLSSDALPLFSDFDGDNRLDHAELYSTGALKSIHVSFGKFAWTALSFDSGVTELGHLFSDDIDRDGDADLIWMSQSYPRKFVTWLGDGRGNFAIATDREHQALRAFLASAAKTRVAGDSDDRDSNCTLQTPIFVALQPGSPTSSDTPSERHQLSPVSTWTCPSRGSIVRKRGPPARLF